LAGASCAFEYLLGTNDEAYTLGEALSLSSGALTACAATTTPTFICMKTQAAETTAVTPLPVIRVTEDQEYATTLSASGTGLYIGDAVTISADSLEATATTGSGVFYLSEIFDSGADGSVVHGYFKN